MAANEISIHLSTFLRDNGIKATKAQVQKLAREIETLNRKSQQETERTERALGRLPGVFGKIQSAATGTLGGVLSAIGALKLGIDIGNWIQAKVIRPLFKIKDPIEELKRQNREIEASWKKAMDAFDASMRTWSASWSAAISATDKARQNVEDLAAAYLKLQAARGRNADASADARLLAMERDKFNDMASARSPEYAASAGKYHDILIAEERARQSLAKFDRDAAASAASQAAAEKALREATQKRVTLKRQLVEIDRKIAETDSMRAVGKYGTAGTDKIIKDLEEKHAAVASAIEAAERDVTRRTNDVTALSAARAAEAQERANIAARSQLEIDERKKAYTDYVAFVEQQDAERAATEERQREEAARRLAEEELRERQALERRIAQERIASLRAELAERQRAEGDARTRQSAAQGSLATAWGWYRDKSRMQGVIDEQKAQAAAEVRWQKDFERLKSFRRDWRTAEFGSLSASDEAVRQVAFAKEEKAAADRAVIETAENTRNLAGKLDELLQAKEG